MKLRIFWPLATAAFAAICLLGSAQGLAQNAYITNQSDNTVSVIDTKTNVVTATIPIPDGVGPFGVATTLDKVYVTNARGSKLKGGLFGTVSVIDTASNAVIATIPVGQAATGVAVTPNGKKAYVANNGDNSVSVIDTATNSILTTLQAGPIYSGLPGTIDGDMIVGITISPDGSTVYAHNLLVINDPTILGITGVTVIDTATDTIIGRIPTSSFGVYGITVTPDGKTLYAAASLSNNSGISVIDVATSTETKFIPIAAVEPFGIAISPNGGTLYVACTVGISLPGAADAGVVTVIDTLTNSVTATIRVGPPQTPASSPIGVSVSPNGEEVYVANAGTSAPGVVSVIDATTGAVSFIPVGDEPIAFGNFIQPAPKFAGTPGTANCMGQSVAALVKQFGGLTAAAAALHYPSVPALQQAIMKFCGG